MALQLPNEAASSKQKGEHNFLVDRLYRFDADEGQQMNKKNKHIFLLFFLHFLYVLECEKPVSVSCPTVYGPSFRRVQEHSKFGLSFLLRWLGVNMEVIEI